MTAQPTLLFAHTVPPGWSTDLRRAVESTVPDARLLVADTPAETLELLPEAEMLLVGRFEEEWFEHAGSLQVVQALSAGIDSLPLERLESEGVSLANASGVHAEPIAEQVLGYMLAFERGFLETARNQRRGVWERVEGGELRDKTVGVVGVGAIGSRVAELCRAFGMEVLGTKRDLEDAPEAVELFPPDAHHELFRRADYVVLACPLTDETEGLVGTPELRLLGSEGVLVNIARGGVVDQAALVRALQYGMIRGAALDVFEEEPLPPESVLWELSNVIVTPHMAGSTPQKIERLADIVTANYEALAAGELEGLVNRIHLSHSERRNGSDSIGSTR